MKSKPRSRTSAKQYNIEQRRAKVAILICSGRNQREIAVALDVSLGTVNSDLKALTEEWKNTQLREMETARAIDLERIDIMINSLWPKAISGNLLAIDRVESLICLRKKIIGYEKETSTPNFKPSPITVIEVIKDCSSTIK